MGKAEMLVALRERGIRLNEAAEALFADCRFVPAKQTEVIPIATVSVADLGFADGATYAQLTARALECHLAECPLELGPHLRMGFMDQPEGPALPAATDEAPPGSITIASPPLDDSEETPKGFYLRRVDGVLWLRGYWSHPGHVWNPGDVFALRRECRMSNKNVEC